MIFRLRFRFSKGLRRHVTSLRHIDTPPLSPRAVSSLPHIFGLRLIRDYFRFHCGNATLLPFSFSPLFHCRHASHCCRRGLRSSTLMPATLSPPPPTLRCRHMLTLRRRHYCRFSCLARYASAAAPCARRCAPLYYATCCRCAVDAAIAPLPAAPRRADADAF